MELEEQVYTPNITDFYFDATNAASFRNSLIPVVAGITTIFTVPPESSMQRNCSGTLVAVQYCYQISSSAFNQTNDIFNFLSLTNVSEYNFTVTRKLTVRSRPETNVCSDLLGSDRICCDTTTVNPTLQFPSSSYTFGIISLNGLLAFNPLLFPEYCHDQLQVAASLSPPDTL